MIKIFHVVAIGALIASASYAYTIKYETLSQTSELVKLKARVHKERESIAVLQAEWQHLNRPDRLQVLTERHTDLQPLKVDQLARLQDIPNRGPRDDNIARKLEALGLGGDETPTGSLPRVSQTPRPASAPRAATLPNLRRAAPASANLTPRPAPRPGVQAAGAARLAGAPAAARPGQPLNINQLLNQMSRPPPRQVDPR
jgi:hypothetical protein